VFVVFGITLFEPFGCDIDKLFLWLLTKVKDYAKIATKKAPISRSIEL
jgi:hypothetical protein